MLSLGGLPLRDACAGNNHNFIEVRYTCSNERQREKEEGKKAVFEEVEMEKSHHKFGVNTEDNKFANTENTRAEFQATTTFGEKVREVEKKVHNDGDERKSFKKIIKKNIYFSKKFEPRDYFLVFSMSALFSTFRPFSIFEP